MAQTPLLELQSPSSLLSINLQPLLFPSLVKLNQLPTHSSIPCVNLSSHTSLLHKKWSTKRNSAAAVAVARKGLSFVEDPVASPADLSFSSPIGIIEYPDPLLRARNKRIDTFDDNLNKLVQEMFEVMYKTDGIGLSAPQVGLNLQLLVFNPAGERGVGEELVLINPKIKKYSKKVVLFNEGCLSFPQIYADVERPEAIKVDAQDVTGARFSISLRGLPARIFQHEFDHLQGVLFFERMTEEALNSIRPSLEELEKKYESRTGLGTPEKVQDFKPRKVAVTFG